MVKREEPIITEENWEDYRKYEAEKQYPVGSEIQCGKSWCWDPNYDNFFKVKKITPTGIIIADELKLEEERRDCDQGGGWIDYNYKTAKITENSVRFFPVLRFDNSAIRKKRNIETKGKYYIYWTGTKDSGYHSLKKLQPDKDGLVRAIIGGSP